MGVSALPVIADIFRAHGRHDTPAAVIQNGSLPNENAIAGTIDTIVARAAAKGIGSPALIVVGEAVGLSPMFADYTAGRSTDTRDLKIAADFSRIQS